ncbi:hypothetical protein RintRC_3304 [Richelia intracellularis]|nr:hypothetical protein RintRC_6972 [Richelia intracellularis]CDN14028.1 hypothetical protein RintRC_3304 [Richelia intracellularis]
MPKGRLRQPPLGGGTGGASPKKVDATGERFPRFRGAR